MQEFPACLQYLISLMSRQGKISTTAYLPNVRTFGFGGPRDDPRHSQTRFAGVYEVRGVHLPSQRLDVLQNGDLDLQRHELVMIWTNGADRLC